MVKKNTKTQLTQSLENYLLAVYEIVKSNTAARVKDVANYLKIGMPSVSDAVKTLAGLGYINYIPYGIITITEKGIYKAEEKLKRHKTIENFLEKVLLIDAEKVKQNAVQIEYSMPEDVLDKFVNFLAFIEMCSCKEPKWIKSYNYYSKNKKMKNKCLICIKNKEKFDNSKCCGSGIK